MRPTSKARRCDSSRPIHRNLRLSAARMGIGRRRGGAAYDGLKKPLGQIPPMRVFPPPGSAYTTIGAFDIPAAKSVVWSRNQTTSSPTFVGSRGLGRADVSHHGTTTPSTYEIRALQSLICTVSSRPEEAWTDSGRGSHSFLLGPN